MEQQEHSRVWNAEDGPHKNTDFSFRKKMQFR